MRGPGSAVFMQSDRNFADSEVLHCRFDDHFRREFHSRRLQFHLLESLLSKGSQSAMKIINRAAEKNSSNQGERRISEPPMFPWHRCRRDDSASSRRTASNHQFEALP